jgi:hypothetical protein
MCIFGTICYALIDTGAGHVVCRPRKTTTDKDGDTGGRSNERPVIANSQSRPVDHGHVAGHALC